MSETDLPRTSDGYPQPLEPGQYAPGNWACALWHVWPAAAFAGAVNTHSHAPACPVCAYPLWRVGAIDPDGYVYFQGRDPAADPEQLEQPAPEEGN